MLPMKLFQRSWRLACVVVLCACGADKSEGAPAAAKASADAKQPTKTEAKASPEPASGEQKTFAQPTAKPPPPPKGAALLESTPLYVQTCDKANACPSLMQPAGETHCRELELGGRENWRLPDLGEAEKFGSIDGLQNLEGFHWTRTAFAEDGKQAWIFDPKSAQKTTIPRDRKPFTIRCVHDL